MSWGGYGKNCQFQLEVSIIFGFAYKPVDGSSVLYVIHHTHELTNMQKFEIDQPSGSGENNEKPIAHFA